MADPTFLRKLEVLKSGFVQLDIAIDGDLKSTVNGVKGEACSTINKFVDAIGTVTADIKTDEFYDVPPKVITTTTVENQW